jgi:hypothetical protein
MMMTTTKGLLLGLFLLQPLSRVEAAPSVEVVSLEGGGALLEAERLTSGQWFAAPRGKTVTVRRGALLQLLVDQQWALGVVGPARFKLRLHPRRNIEVEVQEAEALRLAGRGGRLRSGLWSAELVSTQNAILLHQQRLFLLRGKARLIVAANDKDAGPALPEAVNGASKESPLVASPVTMAAGEMLVLDAAGTAAASPQRISPAEEMLRQTLRYQPPAARGDSEEGELNLAQIQHATAEIHEGQVRERELSSCGCTEGGGASQETKTGQGHGGPSIEVRHAIVRARITGMPKMIR